MPSYVEYLIRLTDKIFARLTAKQRQWLWFVLLWCGGLFSVLLVAKFIRWAMGL